MLCYLVMTLIFLLSFDFFACFIMSISIQTVFFVYISIPLYTNLGTTAAMNITDDGG